MAITVWQKGRRLFSTAAVLMILAAVAHTAGSLASGPEDPVERNLLDQMRSYKVPLWHGNESFGARHLLGSGVHNEHHVRGALISAGIIEAVVIASLVTGSRRPV
jgi:hypothetical protein